MADAVNINHSFVTAKPQSTDSSLVSRNAWNLPLLLSGGQDGQPILKDSTKSTGAKWGQALTIGVGAVSYSGASPSSAQGSVPVTITDNCLVLVIPQVQATVSAGTTYTLTVRRNTVSIGSLILPTGGIHQATFTPSVESTPGTVTFDVTATVGGGATFTSFSGSLLCLTFPRA